METRDPISPETFIDAVWAEFEALRLPDVPAIGARISFAPFSELYNVLARKHQIDLARVWTLLEQELQRPAIVRMRCVAIIHEVADILGVDMPGYDSIAMDDTAEIELPARPESTVVRIAREDVERKRNIILCASLIQEAVQEMGMDPRDTREGDIERLRHALATVTGWILDTDPADEHQAGDDLDTQAEIERQPSKVEPHAGELADDTQGKHQEKRAPETTRSWSAWPVVSAGLAATFAVFLWVGLAEHEQLADENRSLRTQLAEHGERVMKEPHPMAVQPTMFTATVEPGKPFKALVAHTNSESMGWKVTVEDAKHLLPSPAMPVFSHDDLKRGFSLYIHGDKSLHVVWSAR